MGHDAEAGNSGRKSPLLALSDDWCDYLRAAAGFSPRTVYAYRQHLAMFLATSGAAELGHLTFEACERHLRRRFLAGRSESTRRVDVAVLRGFCSYLLARGLIAESPAARLRSPKLRRRERSALTQEEVERVVYGSKRHAVPTDPLDARDRVLLAVIYILALRVSEPIAMSVHELEWHESLQLYSVLVVGAKWAEDDVRMHLDQDTSRLLGAWLPIRARHVPRGCGFLFATPAGRPLTPAYVRSVFARRLKEEGIDKRARRLTLHSLRHSIARHLLDAGWDIRDVQRHLRHKHLETTEVYLGTRPPDPALMAKKHPLRRRRG